MEMSVPDNNLILFYYLFNQFRINEFKKRMISYVHSIMMIDDRRRMVDVSTGIYKYSIIFFLNVIK